MQLEELTGDFVRQIQHMVGGDVLDLLQWVD